MTSQQIKAKYGCSSYRAWNKVPAHLITRSDAKQRGIIIPADAKPDAVKNSSGIANKNQIYFLFNINKYAGI